MYQSSNGSWLEAEMSSSAPVQPVAQRPGGKVDRSSRDYIRWVQRSLNKMMGLRLAEDGIIGAQTRQAIIAFQRQRGLAVDGKVGPQTARALSEAGQPLPATGQTRPTTTPPGAPALLRQESAAIGTTLYAAINLAAGQHARPMTGLFIPAGYRAKPRVDVILYLHGVKTHPTLTIDQYWDARRYPHFALREELQKSGRNVVLVAPTLGPRSQTGRLTHSGGLDAFLAQALAALRAHAPQSVAGGAPQLGNLILACHSGGGLPMRRLALGGDAAAGAIRECWGFDCTYNTGDDTLWAQWAKQRPNVRLFIYYVLGGKTAPRAEALRNKKVPNVNVLPSKPPVKSKHNWVPITHWRERIEGAPFLNII